MDPDPSPVKERIARELEECTDLNLLNVIYNLLTYYNEEGQSC